MDVKILACGVVVGCVLAAVAVGQGDADARSSSDGGQWVRILVPAAINVAAIAVAWVMTFKAVDRRHRLAKTEAHRDRVLGYYAEILEAAEVLAADRTVGSAWFRLAATTRQLALIDNHPITAALVGFRPTASAASMAAPVYKTNHSPTADGTITHGQGELKELVADLEPQMTARAASDDWDSRAATPSV